MAEVCRTFWVRESRWADNSWTQQQWLKFQVQIMIQMCEVLL